MAHSGDDGRRPWRPATEVRRARGLPLIATVIPSIKPRTAIVVPWRPVLKQVPPCRSRKLAAAFDPLRPSVLQIFCVAKFLREAGRGEGGAHTGNLGRGSPARVDHPDAVRPSQLSPGPEPGS